MVYLRSECLRCLHDPGLIPSPAGIRHVPARLPTCLEKTIPTAVESSEVVHRRRKLVSDAEKLEAMLEKPFM